MLIGCDRSRQDRRTDRLIDEGLALALVGPGSAHPRWDAIRGGAERYAREVPTVNLSHWDRSQAPGRSLRQTLADALEAKPAGICLFLAPADVEQPAGLVAALDLIGQSNALLVTIGAPYEDTRIVSHVSVNWSGGAELLARHLDQLTGGGRTYVLLHDRDAGQQANASYLRFKSVASEQHDMTLLRELAQSAHANPAEGVESLLDMFPHAALLISLDDSVWQGATHDWFRRLTTLNADFRFATLSTAPGLWRWLGTPKAPGPAAGLVGPLDGDLGYEGLRLLSSALLSEDKPADRRWIECELVTPASLPSFARRYAKAANDMDTRPFLGGTLPPAPDE